MDLIERQSVLKAIDECERLSMVSQTVRNMTSLKEVVQGLPAVQTCEDAVSRADVIELVKDSYYNLAESIEDTWAMVADVEALPAVQTEPLSDAYTKAVWTWLLDYQIKAAELKGRYTPYEVLSWVANDWRKEHEGSD